MQLMSHFSFKVILEFIYRILKSAKNLSLHFIVNFSAKNIFILCYNKKIFLAVG